MSRYTTELRYLIEQGYDLGMMDYEIFDEAYRKVLNNKILDHFRFHEIGFETPARFKHYLNTTLNEVMPYYNILYKLELEKINPFISTDYEETFSRELDGTTTSNAEGSQESTNKTTGTTKKDDENKHFGVHSQTPAGMIKVGDIKSHTWADQAQMNEDSSKENTTLEQTEQTSGTSTAQNVGKINNLEDYIRTIKGTMGGSKGSLLKDFVGSLMNIDLMVIDELNSLFMGVF